MSDENLIYIVSLLIGILALPYRRKLLSDTNEFLFLALFVIMGPIFLIALLVIGFHKYKYNWVEYLIFRDEEKIAKLTKEFNEWSKDILFYLKINPRNVSYGIMHEEGKASFYKKLENIKQRISKREHYLILQANKWWFTAL